MAFPGETMIVGRDFPMMVREYEDPHAHWSLDWMVWGAVLGTASVLALIMLLWWLL